MKRNTRIIVALAATAIAFSSAPAWAHEGHEDIIVGRTSGNQLTVEFDGFGETHELAPVNGLFNGWAGDDPGFAHLEADEPVEDFYTLQSGADIYLEIVSIDTALRGNPLTDDLDVAGEQALLGGYELHEHIDWLIDSDDAGFDPLQTQWDVSFKLVDMGATTNYSDSDIYTLSFTNVPEPASVVLLAVGGLAAIRRRTR